MITQSSRQSFFLVFVTAAITVSASAKLSPRQACDTLVCPDLSWFWGIFGGAAAWLGGQNGREEDPPIEDFLLLQPTFPSSPSPETFQTTPSENRAAHRKKPKAENEIEILVTSPNNRKSTEECVAVITTSQGGGTNNLLPGLATDFDNCDQSMEKVVWPMNCESEEQNTNTERVMSEMGVKFFTIIDPGCVVQGGAFFWLVPKITPQQTQALNRRTGSGVRAIQDNPPLEFTESSERPARTQVPANHRKRRSSSNNFLSKRARVSVVKQNSDQALAYLSTGPAMRNSGIYSYFSPAGAGVRVYVLGSGFNYVSEEFSDRSISWIFANDVSPQKSDAATDTPTGRFSGGGGGSSSSSSNSRPTYPHSGTCLVSKVLGKYHGVAKRADLTMVKMRPSVGSFLSAISQVIQSLRKKGLTKGRVVLNFTGGFVPKGRSDNFAIACERIINILVNELQVVVVTSAGGSRREAYADISTLPALLSLEHNIITVGAVLASTEPVGDLMNGQRFPWSRGGPALTVSAPANGQCMGPFGGEVDISTGGDVISTAIVTGLVAYILSLPDLGDSLRAEGKDTPEAVIRWLKLMSYRRFQAQESVWNGLDSESDAGEFENWMGVNPPDK